MTIKKPFLVVNKLVQFASWPIAIGVIVALLALQFCPNLKPASKILPAPQNLAPVSYADAVSRAAAAVVTIYTENKSSKGAIARVPLGSGVIVDKSGIILTNNHVINGVVKIQVLLNGPRFTTAELIGVDTENDLAVLKIDLDNLFAINIGQPNNLRVGDVVLAIGNPYGVGQSVSQGIVSGLGRYGLGINNTENFIQTDAAINPGNSGGALIDALGNLVGINTAILDEKGTSSVGISFAVPADIAINSLKQILQYGHIKHVWLGFTVNQPRYPNATQLEVVEIQANSPVAVAGLQVGDLLLQINGVDINDVLMAKKLISGIQIGSEITLKVSRNGENRELHLKAQSLPQ